MVIPFRRTIWSSSRATTTLGDDRIFVALWSGRRPGISGFRLLFWAMDDQYNGTANRTVTAQASNNGWQWEDITLDPSAPTTGGAGLNPDASPHALLDHRHEPYLRIGLMVNKATTPTGSAVQTIEGRLTLIGESVQP